MRFGEGIQEQHQLMDTDPIMSISPSASTLESFTGDRDIAGSPTLPVLLLLKEIRTGHTKCSFMKYVPKLREWQEHPSGPCTHLRHTSDANRTLSTRTTPFVKMTIALPSKG
jgi:hypothetical protein